MKIETKYEIGQHIWVVSKINGGMPEVSVYDDYIEDIVIDKNGYTYATGDTYQEYKEDELILYEDTNKLVKKIKELLKEIAEEE